MFCPNCNNEVAEGTLVCTTCGAPVARIAQEQKVAAAKEAVGNSVKKWFLSPLFIVIASFISLVSLFEVISVFVSFAGGIVAILISLVFNLIPAIFAILATVGAWKVVASRNKPIEASNINKTAKFFGVMRAFKIVSVVLSAIAGAFLTVFALLIWVALDTVGDFADKIFESLEQVGISYSFTALDEIGATLFFAVVIVFVALIIMYANYAAAYGNARNHLKVLTASIEEGADVKALSVKPPYLRLFILGGINLIAIIFAFPGFLGFMTAFCHIGLIISYGVMFILIKKNSAEAIEELNKENAALEEINALMQPAYQPAYQQPMYQQPMYQQPMYQQPAYQQPAYQQPMYQQPAYQQQPQQPQQPAYQQPQQAQQPDFQQGYQQPPQQ